MRSGPIITRFGRAGEYYYHHRLHRCHRQNLTKNLCNLCNLWSESSSHTTSAAADWLYNRAMFTTRRWAIVLMLGAGLAVRLLIAPHGGHPYDLVVIGGWAADVAQTGYLNAYANTPANYGPLMVALMGLTARLYLWLGGASFETSGLWPVVFKLPSIVCDLGIGWLVYRLASDREIDVVGAGLKRCGRTRSVRASSPAPTTGRPVLLAGLVIFHPALILLSAWWGQYEQPYTLPLLVSAALLARADNRLDRLIASGVALGLGVMVKPTALASLPALSLMALHGGWQARNPHPLRPKVVALTPCKGEGESARAPMGGGLARSALLWALGVAAACLFWLAPFIVTGQAGLVWGRRPVGGVVLFFWPAVGLGRAGGAAPPPAVSPSPIARGGGRGGARP